MTRLHLLLALALAALLTSTAEAGPFRRRSSVTATCTGPNCGRSAPAGDTSTAQGVAEIMAARGGRGHFGGNSGREGVGEGPTREAAIQACCYHPQNGRRESKIDMSTADVGAAQSSSGRWFACIRGR
jgi:hypothetical protein